MAKKNKKNILVTGGSGFIGSHLIDHLLRVHSEYNIYNLDKLTYAGKIENNKKALGNERYQHIIKDINSNLEDILTGNDIDTVIHLAAETHVDNSIVASSPFIMTNIVGTYNLLNACKTVWGRVGYEGKLFYQVSTDEVYGALTMDIPEGKKVNGKLVYGSKSFDETCPYQPHSPYSASKASADHLVRAFHDTYGLPIIISNCSNNYGPRQHREKLIPLCIEKIYKEESIPVYGTGTNVRDWLFVEDHAMAIDLILHHGRTGETYCIGGDNEMRNIDIIQALISEVDLQLGRPENASSKLITYVPDRPGHDMRYSICADKLKKEIGWYPKKDFKEGLRETVKWYLDNLQKSSLKTPVTFPPYN